jgi:hypothetical protein
MQRAVAALDDCAVLIVAGRVPFQVPGRFPGAALVF